LRNFRRPDITLIGDQVQVHSLEEKEPIPLNIYHYPLCITFGFCEQVETLIVDPTEKEEQVLDGKIIMGVNSHREICAVHCSGTAVYNKEQLLRCSSKAVLRAKALTGIINKVFIEDAKSKTDKARFGISNLKLGFANLIGDSLVTGAAQNEQPRQPLPAATAPKEVSVAGPSTQKSPETFRKGKVARVKSKVAKCHEARLPMENDSDIEIIEEKTSALSVIQPDAGDQEVMVVETKKKRRTKPKAESAVQSLLDEIEDDVQILLPTDSGYKTASMPDSEPTPDVIDLGDALRSAKPGKGRQRKNK